MTLTKSVLEDLADSNKNIFDQRDIEGTKQKQCFQLLRTLEAIIEAENNCELDFFKNPTKNKDKTAEQTKTADKIMSLLHESSMISSSEYASYLVQETRGSGDPNHYDENAGRREKRQSKDMKRLNKVYSTRTRSKKRNN